MVTNMFAAIMTSNLPCLNYRKTVLVHSTVSKLTPWVLDGLEADNQSQTCTRAFTHHTLNFSESSRALYYTAECNILGL